MAPSSRRSHSAGNAFASASALCVNVMLITATPMTFTNCAIRMAPQGRGWSWAWGLGAAGCGLNGAGDRVLDMENGCCQSQRQRPCYLASKLLTRQPLFTHTSTRMHKILSLPLSLSLCGASCRLFALQRQLLSIINFR